MIRWADGEAEAHYVELFGVGPCQRATGKSCFEGLPVALKLDLAFEKRVFSFIEAERGPRNIQYRSGIA